MKIETIETARLALRGFTPEDAPFAMSLWNDPDTGRWLSDPALEEIPDLAAYTKSVEGLGDSLDCCHLVAVDRATGQRIGTCSFVPENGGRSYDIAYAVHPDFQRQAKEVDESVCVVMVIQISGGEARQGLAVERVG